MRRFFVKILKIVSVIFFGLLLIFLIFINIFFKPISDDEIRGLFSEVNSSLYLENQEYNGNRFRVISTRKELDTTLPNLVFIHGSPGSAMDFKRYLFDADLNAKANLIAFDRVGYSLSTIGDIQNISFEVDVLNSLTSQLNVSKTILVGYSFGGSIALASKKKYKKIVLCAPAVSAAVEPMFWFLNFYQWKATRWLMPDLLKAASKEKLQHPSELKKYEEKWRENPSEIYVIHGDKDWIVPYENSIFIKNQFPKEKFELITLNEASHDLIWTRFDEIKNELIKVIEE